MHKLLNWLIGRLVGEAQNAWRAASSCNASQIAIVTHCSQFSRLLLPVVMRSIESVHLIIEFTCEEVEAS